MQSSLVVVLQFISLGVSSAYIFYVSSSQPRSLALGNSSTMMKMTLASLLLAAGGASAFMVAHGGVRTRVHVHMAAVDEGECSVVASLPTGDAFACDTPQGLGSEQQLINGQVKWVRYPQMPRASASHMVDDACTAIGERLWACKTRPNNGINCEEQFIDGEMVWACVV